MASIVILLGPPGAGKGTQAARLSAARSIPHVSTGDLFRSHLRRGTPIGRKADAFLSEGKLVPDEVVLDMLGERVAAPDCRRGYVLDGFPRTLAQAQALDRRLNGRDSLSVVNLDVSEGTIVERALGRLSCSQCGRVYNLKSSPPEASGRCDACGGELVQRADDAPEIVRERLRVYRDETEPLVQFYRAKSVLRVVDGEQDPEVIFATIDRLIPKVA